ncbi:hypothetical protein ACFSKN_11565 [Mariniflexile gromovii]|uniref:Uncharacterized protein n=1 Tax=Mariniflexile gromovii TaxID=362523 RepID=A0ABS4BVB9_9FLAO|nr:hypothetical protein [Mariniflexile gromovii]MBP0904530.1 hypothetical protein [Mariniflexile gromovii]
MKLFFKHIIIFALAFFIVEKGVWFILNETPKKQYDKRLELLIKGKINKDIIVLGSSRGAGNILAGQLEKETGLTAYNLSYQGSNVDFHKFILETLLKFNKAPQYVLLSIDNSSQFIKDESLNYREDAVLPLTKYNYINNELVNEKINSPLSYAFFLGRYNKFHSLFRDAFVNTRNPIDSFGSMGILKKNDVKLNYVEKTEKYNQNFEKASRIKAFKNIQKLCKLNNIKLVFVFSPSFYNFESSFYTRFKKLDESENGIFVYDSTNNIYRNQEYFYDKTHLFINGAKIFSTEISNFINTELSFNR